MIELQDKALCAVEQACALFPSLSAQALKNAVQSKAGHGHFARWTQAIDALPLTVHETTIAACPQVRGQVEQSALWALLQDLKPWRKGHFHLFDVDLDSEWRSELKYARVQAMGVSLAGKQILDVGCGNGYYLLRLLGDGARAVLGLDPSFHYFAQYLLLARCFPVLPQQSAFLPLTLDDGAFTGFDLTLSMGVLYHRRDPVAHLKQLADTLQVGGELLLETLVLDSVDDEVLIPEERYAGMRNVYHVPSTKRLCAWLEAAGLEVEQCGELAPTTTVEQRKTPWIDSFSLEHFLNPQQTRTVEDLPPPIRQILRARKR